MDSIIPPAFATLSILALDWIESPSTRSRSRYKLGQDIPTLRLAAQSWDLDTFSKPRDCLALIHKSFDSFGKHH